jgi:hypothetical protein
LTQINKPQKIKQSYGNGDRAPSGCEARRRWFMIRHRIRIVKRHPEGDW